MGDRKLKVTLSFGVRFPMGWLFVIFGTTPLCGRPDRLALGSQWDNLHDYFAKHGQWTAAKHTPAQVSEIRHSTESLKSVAEKFPVSEHEIDMMRKGRRYAWVDKLRKEVIAG